MTFITRVRAAIDGMPVGRQLYGSFFIVLLLTSLVGGLALYSLSRVDAEAEALAGKWLKGVGHLASARARVLEARDLEIKHSRTDDSSYHAEYEEKMAEAHKQVAADLSAYQALPATGEDKALFATLRKGLDGYLKAQVRVVELGRAKQKQDAADISDGLASMAFDETVVALDALTHHNFAKGDEAAAHTTMVYDRAIKGMLALLGCALLTGVLLAWGITRRLLRQLGGEPRTATAIARAVAEGDLTTPITLRPGDADSLMARLDAMQRSLARAVTAVRQGAEHVALASAEIAQGNQDLSNRTEHQAGALQQTSATMVELDSTVRTNADNANQANELAAGASAVAVKGGNVVGQVVETMRGINDSSKKIADIIGVIDGIAFQTNILALNAAVEAARAGEQGKGFAVVASEVRNLAQRSAGAAREIKALIATSVERVEQGTSLVDQAGQTMGEIVSAIQRVSGIVAEISAASVAQSSGVAQVGQNVAQMDQTTQQNAALVEQSAAAAESLKDQSRQLVQAVAVFKVEDAPQA